MIFTYLKEGLRFYARARRIRKNGFPQYVGTAEEMCEQIIYDCYNKKKNYFMVSNGNFKEFYARDFGFCTESLINLGFEKEVRDTLNYALEIFRKKNKIMLIINPNGRPFNFPNVYSPDAVAFIFRSLYDLKDKDLITKFEDFLQKEIFRFYKKVIDNKSSDGLIKPVHFSAMNDHAIRIRSCYDTCMAAMLSGYIEKINSELHFQFENPLKNIDFKHIIASKYWNFGYFLDDLDPKGSKCFSSDANIFPFYSGIINDGEFLDRISKKIQDENFDDPYPLKYRKEKPDREDRLSSFFAADYERTTAWLNLGMCYLKVLDKFGKTALLKMYLEKFEQMILKHQNFLEVFDSLGQPYKSKYYICDDSMIWCSVWLELKRKYG